MHFKFWKRKIRDCDQKTQMVPQIKSSFSYRYVFTLFLALAGVFGTGSAAQRITDPWFEGSFSEFREDSQKNGKPYVVEIMASWCGYCRKFEKLTMKDPSVLDYMEEQGIRILSIDGEKGEGLQLARKNNVKGFPTILFFDSSGDLVKRVDGYLPPRGFLSSLKEFSSFNSMDQPMLNYLNQKQAYFENNYSIAELWPEKHCGQAYTFAINRESRKMKELELELDDPDLMMASLVYSIYSNNSASVPEITWKCVEMDLLNEIQQHFLSFYIAKNSPDFYLSHQLINESIRRKPDINKSDTRCGIEYLTGNFGDARSSFKKIRKQAGNKENLPVTFEALDHMVNSGGK